MTSPPPEADSSTEASTQRSLTVRDLAALLAVRARGEKGFDLIDVREPGAESRRFCRESPVEWRFSA